MKLQVGADPGQPPGRLGRLGELDVVGGQDLVDRRAVGVAKADELARLQRAGERGAAEQAASEPRALLVGEVDQHEVDRRLPPASAQARSTPSPAMTPSAPSRGPPTGTESR